MPRRELLQLAQTYNALRHDVSGWLLSEKLDGSRCFWDGGASRGDKTVNVPWASTTDPKTGKPKGKVKEIATGLWSRYGNPIMAPDWFLDSLPCCPLDGELFAGRGRFQTCRSITSRDEPDSRWSQISYQVYGSPSPYQVFRDGEIKNSNMHELITQEACQEYMAGRVAATPFTHTDPMDTFCDEIRFLSDVLYGPMADHSGRVVQLVRQTPVPANQSDAIDFINEQLNLILDKGGEGVMLRDPNSVWVPKRVHHLLKCKPFHDDEATIVGFVAGREGKQGNLLGRIGALIVNWKGVEFELGSGLMFLEREIKEQASFIYACEHPGERLPDHIEGDHFKIGDTVTFKYRELTDAGVPKEGRYWRKP